ncbi:unnamed protein product [Arctogadus glacialis]
MEEEDVHVENGFHASSKESDRQQRLRLCVLNEILNTERAYVRTLLFLQSEGSGPARGCGRTGVIFPGPGGIPVRIMVVWLFWKGIMCILSHPCAALGRSRNVRNPLVGESQPLPQQHPGVLCPGPPSQSRLRPRFRTPRPRGYVLCSLAVPPRPLVSGVGADRLSES